MKEIKNIEMFAYTGLRKCMLYPEPADGRKSFEGLSKLVIAATGKAPHLNEAYVFMIKNHHHVKILMKTSIGVMIQEHYGAAAATIRRICIGLVN